MSRSVPAVGHRAPLRVGVIGGGLIAQAAHLPSLSRLHGRFQLVAVADPSLRRREALSARFAISGYADWRALLEREDLDAAVVCSPNATHAEITLAALSAGLHVLVEKPLCVDPNDGRRIVAAQARTGAVVQVGYMKRLDPAVELLLAAIADRVQPLRYIDVVTRDPWLPRAPFFRPGELVDGNDVPSGAVVQLADRLRNQVEAAVGARSPAAVRAYDYTFLSCLIHDVNLVHACLRAAGEPLPARPVSAAAWAEGRAGSVVQALGDGARWITTWLLLPGTDDFHERVELYFEDAVHALHFDAPYLRHPTLHARTGARDGRRIVTTATRPADSYLAQLEHFSDCIAGQTSCAAPPDQGLLDVEVLAELYRLAEGEPLQTAQLPRTKR
jgi:predicted dehydrogenase